MSLLAPFKLCIQCLPVFSSESPPPSPRASSVGEYTETEKNAHLYSTQPTSSANASAECALSEGEKPSFSDASLIHDSEQKDLPISQQAKIELVDAGLPAFRPVAHVLTSTPEARSSPKVDKDNAHPDVAQPASKQESPHITVMPTHDVDFLTSGMMPLPSPITPAPIGLGYIVGQHSVSHRVHHQISSHLNEGHSFFHIHGHDKAHPLSSPLHSTHEKDPSTLDKEHATPSASSPHSVKVHESPPLSASSQSGKELASNPSQDKGHESKENPHHRHSPDEAHGNQGDLHNHTPPHESSVSKHGDDPHPHEKHMETSHSVPHINLVASHGETYDHDTDNTGALVTSHSEPMEAIGGGRVRRRDHLKHHFKELHDQLKQGGHHLKEEGSKHLQSIANLKEEGSRHLQSMVSNMNKHAGEDEEAGNFFYGATLKP